jgi:signal transduction histidine kinase
LNAELIDERTDDKDSKKRISSVLRAIDGSTELIRRTKKLGSILAADRVDLYPMGLKGALARSVSLVRKAYPEKEIEVKGNLKGHVLADALLDDVFTNIITNSVRYTEGGKVRVKVTQEQTVINDDPAGEPKKCWKVSFSDWGRGIPESMKPEIFRRYLQTARGNGLGMSIIHALVTDRYGGKARVKDRVPGHHRKGTIMVIWLPRP